MNLKCKINGNEYNITQGCTFSEEYNETLDSGTIIINHVNAIENLMPFDDVYIWNSDEEFNGYSNSNIEIVNIFTRTRFSISEDDVITTNLYLSPQLKRIFDKYSVINSDIEILFTYMKNGIEKTSIIEYDINYDGNNKFTLTPNLNGVEIEDEFPTMIFFYINSKDFFYSFTGFQNVKVNKFSLEYTPDEVNIPRFYRHLLVDQFSEELINIKDKIYKYKIELFSETKGLEVIQLPNISITQPLNIGLKRSVYDYIVDFVNMYSPVEKIADDENRNTWKFSQKYVVSPSLKDTYSNVYSPDFTLNSPNLRDVLSKLFLVKDMIPYVHNGIIYGLDITKRKNKFFDLNPKYITSITGSRSSDNHCDNLRRTYSESLSQDNTARMVEYLGFRNKDNALMTIENMRIETGFPIYKINKIYMCYYKKIKVGGLPDSKDKMFLCKQDITPLVKLESERNLLSQDWDEFNEQQPSSIEAMAKYKLCTVGYNIGSNYIEGWGTKYTYPIGWYDITATYIENILKIIDNIYPYGIYQYGYIKKIGGIRKDEYFYAEGNNFFDNLIVPIDGILTDKQEDSNIIENNSVKFKGIFFIVDYQAFYNGAIIHSKDQARDDITINDNVSSSLTLLEQDGIYQKEKANRFGNKGITINARYEDVSYLQELGSVYEYNKDNDVIIYHRSYSIFDNYVKVEYRGTKSYVLRNYFTSVYAKHRTYNLMSYSESVNRAENKKMYIMMSKNNIYYEKENIKFKFSNFDGRNAIQTIMSFLIPTEEPKTINYFELNDKINYGYIRYKDVNYATDINMFVCGNSLCFNMAMVDNVTSGVYISEITPKVSSKLFIDAENIKDDYTGSIQKWYMLADNNETGFIEKIGFYIAHVDKSSLGNDIFKDGVYEYDSNIIKDIYKNNLFVLPKITSSMKETNVIGMEYEIHKDNKERINMTFQIEPSSDSDDIMFSSWMMKLSDLLSSYIKIDEPYYEAIDSNQYNMSTQIIHTTLYIEEYDSAHGEYKYFFRPLIIMYLTAENLENLKETQRKDTDVTLVWDKSKLVTIEQLNGGSFYYYAYNVKKIIEVTDNYIIIEGDETLKENKGAFFTTALKKAHKNIGRRMKLYKQEKIGNYAPLGGYYYYSNMEIKGDEGDGMNKTYDENLLYYMDGDKKVIINEKKYRFADGKEFYYDMILNTSNAYFETIYLSIVSSDDKTEKYYKNMYLVESTEKLQKTKVYNEYKLNQISTSSLKVSDVFYLKSENDKNYININLNEINKNVKSLQFWYLDRPEKLRKVKYDDTKEAIVQSAYNQNIKLTNAIKIRSITLHELNENNDWDKNNVYAELSKDKYVLNNDIVTLDLSSYSETHLNLAVVVNYYSYSFEEQEGSLKFVFGVNINDEDWNNLDEFNRPHIKIYLSLLSTRDTRVYDRRHNLIGEIYNYNINDSREFGEDQFYYPNKGNQ